MGQGIRTYGVHGFRDMPPESQDAIEAVIEAAHEMLGE